jgi:hypothetical protein
MHGAPLNVIPRFFKEFLVYKEITMAISQLVLDILDCSKCEGDNCQNGSKDNLIGDDR